MSKIDRDGRATLPRRSLCLLLAVLVGLAPVGLVRPVSAATPGPVIAWGDNSFDQLKVPASYAIAIGSGAGALHSLSVVSTGAASDAEGKGFVAAWGWNDYGQTNVPSDLNSPFGGSTATAVSAGGFHSLALKGDGTVSAWGDNGAGQLKVPTGLIASAIAAGYLHSLALKDGAVIAWGDNRYGQLYVPISAWSDVTAIAAGGNYSLALKRDGTVVAWGDSGAKSLNVPPGMRASAIAAGASHSLAIGLTALPNAAPTVGTITLNTGYAAGAPIPVNTIVPASAPFTDPNAGDTHKGLWEWGPGITNFGYIVEPSGSTPGSVNGSYTYTAAGVYTVKVTVTDQGNLSGQATYPQYLVVYDPNGGFVTGGGWFSSPADGSKASFGFTAQYQQGNTVPTGSAQFRLQGTSLDFTSSGYDWLVVSGTPPAQALLQGSGTINGQSGYKILIAASDGKQAGTGIDQIRVKIWNPVTGQTVYDSQPGAPDNAAPATRLGAGSITVH